MLGHWSPPGWHTDLERGCFYRETKLTTLDTQQPRHNNTNRSPLAFTECAFTSFDQNPFLTAPIEEIQMWKKFAVAPESRRKYTQKYLILTSNVWNVSLYLNISQSDNKAIIPGYDLMILPGLWTEKTSQLFSSSPSDTINNLLNRKIIF